MPLKQPSVLGRAIEEYLEKDPKIQPYCEDHKKAYAILYQTDKSTPFAVERVTKSAINIWIGPDESKKEIIESKRIQCEKKVFSGNPINPGWNSNIKKIKEFHNASAIYLAKARSVADAAAIVESLD